MTSMSIRSEGPRRLSGRNREHEPTGREQPERERNLHRRRDEVVVPPAGHPRSAQQVARPSGKLVLHLRSRSRPNPAAAASRRAERRAARASRTGRRRSDDRRSPGSRGSIANPVSAKSLSSSGRDERRHAQADVDACAGVSSARDIPRRRPSAHQTTARIGGNRTTENLHEKASPPRIAERPEPAPAAVVQERPEGHEHRGRGRWSAASPS